MVTQGNSANGQSATPTTTGVSQSSAPAVRAFISQVTETTQSAVARQRPWPELMDRKAFYKPESFADATGRMKKNITYFRMNYIIFMLLAIGLSLLWHPVSLIVLIILVLAWMYFYFGRSEPVIVFNWTVSENQVLIILGIATIGGLFLTKAGTTLISALIIGVVIICLHAAFRCPDDLFLNEQESSASGLLRFPTSTRV